MQEAGFYIRNSGRKRDITENCPEEKQRFENRRQIMLEENVIIPFLKKFDQYPFSVKINGKEYRIGDGEPEFTVD